MLIHKFDEFNCFLFLILMECNLLADVEEVVEEGESGFKGWCDSITLKEAIIVLQCDVFTFDFRQFSILRLNSLIIYNDITSKGIPRSWPFRRLIDIQIEAGKADTAVVFSHFWDKLSIIDLNGFDDLYLISSTWVLLFLPKSPHLYLYFSFGDILLEWLHVEVVEMCEVEVQLAHLLDCLTEIVSFQTAMEHNVIAQLRDLALA